jgi:hypothetical protein
MGMAISSGIRVLSTKAIKVALFRNTIMDTFRECGENGISPSLPVNSRK